MSDTAEELQPPKKRKKKKKKKRTDQPATVALTPPLDRRALRIGLAVTAVGALAFYGSTMSRWIGLGDTALLLDEMVKLSLNSHVNNHKLAVLFGHLFQQLPVGEIAFRGNLMSVVFGSATVVVLFAIAYRTLGKLGPALLATAALAVMHSLWWHSTIVENYAINALALVSVLLLLMIDEERPDSKYFYGACFVAGLAVVNHIQNLILPGAVLVYAVAQYKKENHNLFPRLLKMTGCALVGFAPYLAILVRDTIRAGDPKHILYWATGGDFQKRMFDFEPSKVFGPLLHEFLVQFPSPMLLFAMGGIYWIGETSWRSKTNIAMTAAFLVNTAFFAQFHTWDKFAFLLPSFLIVGWWGIIGMKAAYEWSANRPRQVRLGLLAAAALCVAMPPWVYASFPAWGRESGFWHQRFNNNFTVNTHDCAKYIGTPDKHDWDDVDSTSRLLLEKLPPNALFFDDDARLYYPLHDYFQRYYGMRPDLTVAMMNSWGFSGWGWSEEQFVRMARQSIDKRGIFLVSVLSPHDRAVARLAEHGIVPTRFPLDDDTWVYQLVRAGSEPLHVHDVFLGREFDTHLPVLKNEFEPSEAIAVQARFTKNVRPVTVRFRWLTKDGAVFYQSEPFTIDPGNTDVWSHLEGSPERPAGVWQVVIEADGVEVGRGSFEMR